MRKKYTIAHIQAIAYSVYQKSDHFCHKAEFVLRDMQLQAFLKDFCRGLQCGHFFDGKLAAVGRIRQGTARDNAFKCAAAVNEQADAHWVRQFLLQAFLQPLVKGEQQRQDLGGVEIRQEFLQGFLAEFLDDGAAVFR